MNVFIDLCLKRRILDNFLTCIPQVGGAEKVFHPPVSKKLKIVSMPMDNTVKVLSAVAAGLYPGGAGELHLESVHLPHLSSFLGEMSNLQRLHLFHIHMSVCLQETGAASYVVQITSSVLKAELTVQGPSIWYFLLP